MVDLTNVDLSTLPSPGAVTGWGSAVAAILVSAMGLRRKGSTDARERSRDQKESAKDQAEADYFAKALDAVSKERDKWKEQAEEAWALLRSAEQTIARLTALHEEREADLAELRTQISSLRELVVRLAPENLREILKTFPINQSRP